MRYFTILEDFPDSFDGLVSASPVSFHVGEDASLMSPVVVFGAKEEHWELSNLVLHFLDIWGDVFGMADFGWPPPATEGEIEATTVLWGTQEDLAGADAPPSNVFPPFPAARRAEAQSQIRAMVFFKKIQKLCL